MSAHAHQIGHCDTFWADVEPFLNLSHPLLGFGRCTSWGSVKRAVQNFVPQNLKFVPRRYRDDREPRIENRLHFSRQDLFGSARTETIRLHAISILLLSQSKSLVPGHKSDKSTGTLFKSFFRHQFLPVPRNNTYAPKSKLGLHGDAWLIPCQRMPRKKFSTCQSCYI